MAQTTQSNGYQTLTAILRPTIAAAQSKTGPARWHVGQYGTGVAADGTREVQALRTVTEDSSQGNAGAADLY
jgi:hypothetical protein